MSKFYHFDHSCYNQPSGMTDVCIHLTRSVVS